MLLASNPLKWAQCRHQPLPELVLWSLTSHSLSTQVYINWIEASNSEFVLITEDEDKKVGPWWLKYAKTINITKTILRICPN